MTLIPLASLRQPESLSTIRARIVAGLVSRGLPVTQWVPSASGGVENHVVDMVATGVQQLCAQRVADICTTRFLDLAEGHALTYMAKRFYGGVERGEAKFTIQNVFISSSKLAPPIQYDPGRFRIRGVVNEYVNVDSFSVPSNTPPKSLSVRFQGVQPGASYDDVAGTVTNLVTAPAGISVVNGPPSDFVSAPVIGTSTGTISATFAHGPVSYGVLRIRIRTSGQIGAATFDYTTDSTTAWTPAGPVPNTITIAGAAVVFRNGGVSPSFLSGDIFTLFVGDAILQRGADEESDESLRLKCRARWTTLSDVPLGLTIQLWAQLASDEVHRVFVDADPANPGGIIVVLASQSGPASPAAVIAVQDYITARLTGYKGILGIEESVLTQSAGKRQITPEGTVIVKRDLLKQVQVAADTAWRKYLGQVGVGGTVVFDRYVQAIMDAGATDADNLKINGATIDIDLGMFEVPVPADGTTLPSTLAWKPI